MSSSQVLPQARLFDAEHAAKNREWRLAYLADRRDRTAERMTEWYDPAADWPPTALTGSSPSSTSRTSAC